MAEPFTVKHWNEFERSGRWSLARRALGLGSFGMNLVELEPDDRIPEDGEPARAGGGLHRPRRGGFVIDGEEHPAPAGTFARLDPASTPTVVNTGRTRAKILIVSAPLSSGHAPPDWA